MRSLFKPVSPLLLGLLLALSPALAQEGNKTDGDASNATIVGVDTVLSEPLKQTVPVIGRLIAARAGVIAARADGPIAEMRARVGDRVEKDAVVAVLVKDSIYWKHQLSKAEETQAAAALQTAKAVLDLREQELRRLSQLKESAAFSQARQEDKAQEVVRARSAMAEAEAALIRARANLKLAEINLYNTDIRAPFGGVISKRYIDVGAYVNVGSPVIDLIDDLNLEIEANVPAARIDGLPEGTVLSFRLESAHDHLQISLPATVRAVVPNEDPQTRTRTVRFTPNFGIIKHDLATNQSVVLALPAGEASAVTTVHKDAILNRKGNTIVFIVEGGVADIRPVRLGEAVGTRFIVLSGLVAGDVVVVRGNERLRPEQDVRVK